MKAFLKVLLLVLVALLAIKLLPLTLALGFAIGLALVAAVALGLSAVAVVAWVVLGLAAVLSPVWIPLLLVVGVIALCKRTLSLDERNPQAYTLLGEVHVGLGRPAEALRYFERALEVQPKLTQNRLNLADPQARTYLMAQMERYFFGGGNVDAAAGYVPPSK